MEPVDIWNAVLAKASKQGVDSLLLRARGGTVVNDFMGVPVADAAVSFTCARCGHAWE